MLRRILSFLQNLQNVINFTSYLGCSIFYFHFFSSSPHSRPESSFNFLTNPFRLIKYVTGSLTKYLRCGCSIIIGVVILVMLCYILPNGTFTNWTKHNRYSEEWNDWSFLTFSQWLCNVRYLFTVNDLDICASRRWRSQNSFSCSSFFHLM